MRKNTVHLIVIVLFSAAGCGSSLAEQRIKSKELGSLMRAWTARQKVLTAAQQKRDRDKSQGREQGREEEELPGVVFLLRDTILKLDRKSRASWTWRRVYKLLTPEAVREWDKVAVTWAPWYQRRPKLNATVTTPDGKVHKLDPSTITELPANPDQTDVLSNRRKLMAPLPALSVGVVVDVTVTLKESRPLISPGGAHWHTMVTTLPTMRSRLTIIAPRSLPLHFRAAGMNPRPKLDRSSAGRRTLVFEIGPVYRPFTKDPYTPPEVVRSPMVMVTTFKGWAQAAEGVKSIMEPKIRPDEVRSLARRLVGKRRLSKKEMVRRFLEHMHRNVRYQGIAFDDAAIVPRSPAVTLRRTFGDCKDMSVVLVSMLRACGTKAFVALLRTGPGEDIWPDMPGLGVFDHVIVYIPAGEGQKELWVDPTARWARPGQLPVTDSGRYALVMRPGVAGLIKTPPPRADDHLLREIRIMHMASIKGARVVEINEPTGFHEYALRRNAGIYKKEDYRRKLEGYARRMYEADDMLSHGYSPPEDLSRPFVLKLEASNSGKAWTAGGKAYVKINTKVLFDDLPRYLLVPPDEKDKRYRRKHAFWLNAPYRSQLVYRIHPSPAFVLTKLPKSETLFLGPMRLRFAFQHHQKTGMVTVAFDFSTMKQRFSADEVRSFWSAFKRFTQEYPSFEVIFRHRAYLRAEAGKYREAVKIFRSLIRRFPRDPVYRMELAETVLEWGFGQKARGIIKEAVRSAPRSSQVHHSLGWVLEHNEYGTRYGSGFDRAGSIEAYKRAIRLDPKNAMARANLAYLLEHDSHGRRYHDRKDLARAIEQYRYLKDKLKNDEYYDNLLFALLYAGRHHELIKLCSKKDLNDTELSMGLTATVVLNGLQKAMERARRLLPDEDRRLEILHNVAVRLLWIRRYEQAQKLLAIIAKRRPDVHRQLELWRKLRPMDQSRLDIRRPGEMVKKLWLDAFGAVLDEKSFQGLVHPDLPRPTVVKTLDNLLVFHKIAQGISSRLGMMNKLVLDMMGSLSAFEISSDGAEGYRVKVKGEFSSSMTAFYLVKTPSGLRLRALSDHPAELGKVAADLLARGKTRQARRWLAWASDHIGTSSDQYVGHPFAHLWTGTGRGSAEWLKMAAALLMSQAKTRAKEAVPILVRALGRFRKPYQQIQIQRALAEAYSSLNEYKKGAAVYKTLLRRASRAEIPMRGLLMCYTFGNQLKKAERTARSRLAEQPNHMWSRLMLALVRYRQKRYKEVQDELSILIKDGRATALAYDLRAWSFLTQPKSDSKKALEDAVKANEMTNHSDEGMLRTLVVTQLASKNIKDAYKSYRKLLDAGKRSKPRGRDFFFYGALAEDSGLLDVAVDSYKKVPRPQGEIKGSYFEMAQKRLSRIAAQEGQKAGSAGQKPAFGRVSGVRKQSMSSRP